MTFRRSVYCTLALLLGALFIVCADIIISPPKLGRLTEQSRIVRSANGEIINITLTKNGYWRESVHLDDIDPVLIKLLISYEDKRFYDHFGVDPWAIARVLLNFLKSGEINSGASTLTMQTVKLMYPDLKNKKILSKVRQMLEAIRLEMHWSKTKILESYFTLAPYGGNIEGIRAASEAWLQRSPASLTVGEAALLVALPQSPETRRPDLHPQNTMSAKSRILTKVRSRVEEVDINFEEFLAEPLPALLIKPHAIALHLSDRIVGSPDQTSSTTIVKDWQVTVAEILNNQSKRYDAPINLAAMVVERKTGAVKAYVGSSDYSDVARKGAINYLTAVRSPGSTLKPFIYARALQLGLITENQVFNDKSFYRAGYEPGNFDGSFNGKVGLQEALTQSLNIPAIETLELLGAETFERDFRTFIGGQVEHSRAAGLSLAVGGFYMTAEDLAIAYLRMLDPGFSNVLNFNAKAALAAGKSESYFINQSTADLIYRLLYQEDISGQPVVFKTGTSHKRQDAWVVHIFEGYIVVVWLGTADNQPTSDLTGRSAALPISKSIGMALGLQNPSKPKQANINIPSKLQTYLCPRLIEFPLNGEWIKTSTATLAFSGDPKASWYLNGEKLVTGSTQINVETSGVHKISAVKGSCHETSEVFVELMSE